MEIIVCYKNYSILWELPIFLKVHFSSLGLPSIQAKFCCTCFSKDFSSPHYVVVFLHINMKATLIYQTLLTLKIIRPSCPPSHHWTSQGCHFTGLNPISLVGLSGFPEEGRYPQNTNWSRGSSGISSWTHPLLYLHYITGTHHRGTLFLWPLLWLWHTALSFISTWWSNGSCTDLRLPGGHLGMDERTSPTAQPGKDWASCLPCPSNSTAWFHHPARFINNYPIKLSQKSWWPADFQRPHCKNCSIFQVCIVKHQTDQALPNRDCCTTFCPGLCYFKAGLLQFSFDWTSIIHN